MISKILCSILLITTCLLSISQNDSIEKEVRNHISQDELIYKARDLLTIYIQEKNVEKVKELEVYLSNKNETKKPSLSYIEQVLIKFWTEDYVALTNLVLQTDSSNINQIFYRTYARKSNLYLNLFNDLQKDSSVVQTKISSSINLSSEDKSFLNLYLNSILENNIFQNESIIKQSNSFLSQFPNSKYSTIVKTKIRFNYKKSELGYDANFGVGYQNYDSDLGQNFNNSIKFGFGAGIQFRNYFLKLEISISPTSPKQDISFNNQIWEKNHNSEVVQFEASLGYEIFRKKKFSINPFGGIGTTSISPSLSTSEDQEKYDNIRYKTELAYYAGIGIKYKLKKQTNFMQYSPLMETQPYFKLQYRYCDPNLDQGYSNMSGKTHSITLIYGGLMSGRTRIH